MTSLTEIEARSLFRMFTSADGWIVPAFPLDVKFDNDRLSVSSCSTISSPRISTSRVLVVSPAEKLTVIVCATKSNPAVAVSFLIAATVTSTLPEIAVSPERLKVTV